MKELIKFSESNHHTYFFMMVVSIISSLLLFKNRNRFKEMKLLFMYPALSFISGILNLYFYFFTKSTIENKTFYLNMSEKLFLFFEFFLIAFCLKALEHTQPFILHFPHFCLLHLCF